MRISKTTNRYASLIEFGLGESSARVYLALVDQPSMTATALASAADVPRSHLYNVIQELQALDLAEVVADETRRLFRAKPFSNYLARRARELETEIMSIREAEQTLAQALQPPPMGSAGDSEAGEVRLVVGRRAVANEIDAMMAKARESLVVSASDNSLPRLARHLTRWRSDIPESADVEATAYLPRPSEGSAWAHPDFDIAGVVVKRLGCVRPVLSVVTDEESLLLVHPIPDTPDERSGRDFAVFTNDRAFAKGHVGLLHEASRPSPVIRE